MVCSIDSYVQVSFCTNQRVCQYVKASDKFSGLLVKERNGSTGVDVDDASHVQTADDSVNNVS
jgi:hypothetical protein